MVHSSSLNQLLSLVFLGLVLAFCIAPVSAAIFSINGSEIDSELLSDLIRSDSSLIGGDLPPGTVIFFWNTHCGGCHMAWDFLDEFIPEHPEMKLLDYDLYNSPENRTIFEQYKTTYHRTHLSVPSMMIGNLTLEGTQDISNHLGEILELQQNMHESQGFLSNFFALFRNLKLF